MGYTTITICNLYADLCKKLKLSEIANNRENRAYLREVLKRKFDTILIGFGNTFNGNKFVSEEKRNLKELLKDYRDCSMDLVDEAGKYARLKATHPLMAGRYYPGKWKLRPYQFEEEKEETPKEAQSGTDKKVRIRNISQLYLLKQINPCLGKREIPKEVIRRMFRMIHSGKLGEKGFLVLCLNKIEDDYYGIEEAVGMYPCRMWLDEIGRAHV